MDFLHTYNPSPKIFSFGPIDVYWYGLFIVLGILVALFITVKLARLYGVKKETVFDLAFWLIISGIIGARIYDVFLELPFFLKNPLNIFKVWQGGLAIHGGIIAGTIALWIFSKKEKINFWLLSSVIVPGLALAQAIGRWGNYFNQELFGLPTHLPWGIPIEPINRPLEYFQFEYFHPAFLYESLGNLAIFLVLILLHYKCLKIKKLTAKCQLLIVVSYLLLYSVLRFANEFIRIDFTPQLFGLRWPQITSLIIIIGSLMLLLKFRNKDANL